MHSSQLRINIPRNLLFRTCVTKFLDGLRVKNASSETIDGYSKDLEMLNRFVEERYNGIVMLQDINTQDLEDYLSMLSQQKNYQPSSVNRHLCSIRSFYNFAIKRGWTTLHAAASIDQLKAPVKERTFINEQEYEELVNAIDHPTIKTIVQFLYYSGLRITECLTLNVENVDLDHRLIHVKHGKGDKERLIPLSTKLIPVLERYKKVIRPKVNSNRLFALAKTGKVSDVYVNYVLHETTAKLGWKKVVSCHVLRHSFASNLVRNNVHIAHIQKLLGHSDLKTTSRYVHSNMEQLAEAVSVL